MSLFRCIYPTNTQLFFSPGVSCVTIRKPSCLTMSTDKPLVESHRSHTRVLAAVRPRAMYVLPLRTSNLRVTLPSRVRPRMRGNDIQYRRNSFTRCVKLINQLNETHSVQVLLVDMEVTEGSNTSSLLKSANRVFTNLSSSPAVMGCLAFHGMGTPLPHRI